jgi:hypothetical protein
MLGLLPTPEYTPQHPVLSKRQIAIPQPALKRQFSKNHVLGFGRKPFINGSKGEGQTPSRGRGLQGRKKHQRPCCRFFHFKDGILPPRR